MKIRSCKSWLIVVSLCTALAVNALASELTWPSGWTELYPAHRVIGPLYNVGFEDLSVFLIVTEEGSILINTGLVDSVDPIRKNIESLGFDLADIKVLLCMQAHFDHAAALAEIKDLTGAKLYATKKDAAVLAAGGKNDPHFGDEPWAWFDPVVVDQLISQDDGITLGGVTLSVHEHPGHTEGSTSFSLTVEEEEEVYDVLIVNSASINPGKKMFVEPTYEGVGDDFNQTLENQLALDPDVWVAAHGSQYGLKKKHTPGQNYDAQRFVDPVGYKEMVNHYKALYDRQVAAELKTLPQ